MRSTNVNVVKTDDIDILSQLGRRNPSVMVLSRICAALEITLEELFRGIVPLEQLLKAH